MSLSKPNPNEIEVSVFGRGFGEAVAVHIGDGLWFVVDSLKNNAGNAAILDYFAAIGVQPSAVKMLMATHWHDDHVGSLAQIYDWAKEALLVLPIAMATDEWSAFCQKIRRGGSETFSSGVQQLEQVAILQKNSGRPEFVPGVGNRRLLGRTLKNGVRVEVFALAPNDADIAEFLRMVASQVPEVIGRRVGPFERNDLSMPLWITVGDHCILLGADLEVSNDPARGWSGVKNSPGKPAGQAGLVKIAHHGSANGHDNDIWATMVNNNALSVLAPFSNGSVQLPKQSDVARILGFVDKRHPEFS